MSFRRFGGLQYAPKHNIVTSNYNTSNNLLVTEVVGQPNSYIVFESDISGDIIIYGNLDVSGNVHIYGDLDVSGNEHIGGNLDVSGNEYIGGNLDVSGNEYIGGNLDVSGNEHIGGNLDVDGNFNVNGNEYISGNLDVSGNLSNYYGSCNLHSPVTIQQILPIDPSSNPYNYLKTALYIASVYDFNDGLCIYTHPGTANPAIVPGNNGQGVIQHIQDYATAVRYAALALNPNGGTVYVNQYCANPQILDNGFALDISGNLKVSGNVDVSSNLTAEYMFLDSGTSYTTAPNGVVPKSYIDSISSGIYPLPACVCASNAGPITLSGLQTIDGVPLVDGNRVLVNAQGGTGVADVNNGIYIASSGPWSRASDLTTGDNASGTLTLILGGNTYAGYKFVCTTGTSSIIGTDPVLWTEFESYVKIGRGLESVVISGYPTIQVDSSLNFLTNLDNSGNTLNIGAYTNTLNIGPTSSYININNGLNVNSLGTTLEIRPGLYRNNNTPNYITYDVPGQIGTHFFWDNAEIDKGLTVGLDASINSVTVGRGGSNVAFNTVVGYEALKNNTTTGVNNVAIGYQSLLTNTDGSYNTAVGYQSLYTNSTGYNNTAVGYKSLYKNETGTDNTAVGLGSLFANTTGINNAALGFASLNENLSGADNTAVGYRSLNKNTIGNNNTAVGSTSLQYNTGSSNTAIGASSLQNNTTGINNTAVGYQSLKSNTTGNNNTAIGYQSLTNTDSSYNTAVGYQSLFTNSTGVENTAVGYKSLYTNSTGINNTAIGVRSLENNTARFNTAVGALSLNANTIGEDNTAIGRASLFTNTTGQYNVAIGNNSLYFNTCSNNTAVGWSSLQETRSGTDNTSLGYKSGYYNTTGNYNTFLGRDADLSNNGTVQYSNSTAIGYNSKITADNQIVLGTASETVYIPGTLGVTGVITNTATQPASTDSSTKVPTTAWVQSAITSTVNGTIPINGIIMWSGVSIPTNWALCDGTSGTPDLRDRFIVGSGSSYVIGATGGANTVTLTTAEMPAHSHIVTDPGHSHTYDKSDAEKATGNDNFRGADTYTTTNTSTGFTGITLENTGGGGAHENRPPYYALAFIMRIS